jgi:FMN-binding domain
MHARLLLMPVGCLVAAAPVNATVYLSVEQAQNLMLPGVALTPVSVSLSEQQLQAVAEDSGIKSARHEVRAWRSGDGCWFIVDQAIGKHSPITFAVTLDPNGAVRQLEILEYIESYGGEVRLPAWRHQFVGKTRADALEIERNIRNISGATLSCTHLTEAVRRLLSIYALVLAGQSHG